MEGIVRHLNEAIEPRVIPIRGFLIPVKIAPVGL